jgi:hypothetical protein
VDETEEELMALVKVITKDRVLVEVIGGKKQRIEPRTVFQMEDGPRLKGLLGADPACVALATNSEIEGFKARLKKAGKPVPAFLGGPVAPKAEGEAKAPAGKPAKGKAPKAEGEEKADA